MILFLNDIAGSEILLILVFILMFFGSKSIPGLARTMGRTMRQIKEASADIQNEIKKSSSEMKKDLNLEGLIRETKEDIRRPLDQMASDLDNAVKYVSPKRNSHLEQGKIEEEMPLEDLNVENPVETKEAIDSSEPIAPKIVESKKTIESPDLNKD